MNIQNIGIMGSGIVARTLAKGFLKHGFKVMIGTRNESVLADFKAETGVLTGSFSDAASFGRLLVLAVRGSAAMDALALAGREHISGKTVIDATNPIADAAPQNGVLRFFTRLDRALMEDLQQAYPDTKLVKAFNSIGNAHMVNPDFNGIRPSMFIAGNDVAAKNEVRMILDLFGFETEDMGAAEAARAIEPLCMLWCIPGFLNNEWNHVFKLLKK